MPRRSFHQQIQTRAISSVYGKIEQLLLAYPGGKADVTKENVLERYGEIFKAFNDRVTFVILGHFGEKSEDAAKAKQAFEAALLDSQIDPVHQLVFCHTPFAGSLKVKENDVHSEYVQDPFLVMETEHLPTVLLESIQQANSENTNLAEQLAAHAGFLIQPSLVEFEGGNILIGDDYALVGKNVLFDNMGYAMYMDSQNPEQWLTNQLKKTLGVRFLQWIGMGSPLDLGEFHSTGSNQSQPFFHLDLFLTLAGKSKTGNEIALLARIDHKHVKGLNAEYLKKIHEINIALDEVESFLESSGKSMPGPCFEVLRLDMGGIVKDGGFIPYGFNNGHLEWFRGISRAYLPSYKGMEELQARAKDLLNTLGFKPVKFIKNAFEDYAIHKGSLHCLTIALARGTY